MRFIGLAQILGKTLLLLVPLWIVCFIGSSYTEYRSGWNDFWTAGVAWLLIPLNLILPTFIVLRLWASIDSIRSQHQGKAYADVARIWMTLARARQWKNVQAVATWSWRCFRPPTTPPDITYIDKGQ